MFSYSLAPERPQKATVFLPRRHADPINDLGPRAATRRACSIVQTAAADALTATCPNLLAHG